MAIFKSTREKRLWIYVIIVLAAISLTLLIDNPLTGILDNQNIQAAFFMFGMFLVLITILIHGLKTRPGNTELSIWFGLIAVYLMFFLRLGLPERSHLIEYSVLAIFIHKAIIERMNKKNQILKPAMYAFTIAFAIGVLDECIQLLIPQRVFDTNDILFNGLAASMAIGAGVLLRWIRNRGKL